ncbi:MAG: hypothetical protein Q9169_005575 [Polycauliona sp. 2 TL-2023]
MPTTTRLPSLDHSLDIASVQKTDRKISSSNKTAPRPLRAAATQTNRQPIFGPQARPPWDNQLDVQESGMLTCGIPQSQSGVCRQCCAAYSRIDRAGSKGSKSRRVVPQSLLDDHVQVWKSGLLQPSDRIWVW